MAIEETLREYIEEEMAGMYTISMVIVESVDHETRRAEVSLKYEKDIIIDNVPIASPYVGDDAGVIWPVEQDDEGFVLHNRQPITTGLENIGHQEQESDRRFEVEDAILVPLVWNDERTVPSHEPGEFLIAHTSGTTVRMKPDGTAEAVHSNGNVIRLNGSDGSVTLGDPANAAPVLTENATIEYEDTGDTSDGDADTTTKTATIQDSGSTDVDAS